MRGRALFHKVAMQQRTEELAATFVIQRIRLGGVEGATLPDVPLGQIRTADPSPLRPLAPLEAIKPILAARLLGYPAPRTFGGVTSPTLSKSSESNQTDPVGTFCSAA